MCLLHIMISATEICYMSCHISFEYINVFKFWFLIEGRSNSVEKQNYMLIRYFSSVFQYLKTDLVGFQAFYII